MEFYITALLQGLCFSGIALGIYISMKIFNIPDITTDGSYTLGGATTAVLLTGQHSVWLVLPLVAVAGALAGAATGLIHTKLKVNPLLAGILVMTALYSVNLGLMGRSNIPLVGIPGVFTAINISADYNYNSLVILLVFVGALILLIAYLLRTDFGLAMRATGNSESMIRALGVNTNRMKVIGLALANALIAVSGYLMTQFQGFADISMGIGIVITGLGSVIIAESIINWRQITSAWGSLLLVVTGAIIFQMILAVTLSLGVDPVWLKAVTAIFVLLIVGLPRLSANNW